MEDELVCACVCECLISELYSKYLPSLHRRGRVCDLDFSITMALLY